MGIPNTFYSELNPALWHRHVYLSGQFSAELDNADYWESEHNMAARISCGRIHVLRRSFEDHQFVHGEIAPLHAGNDFSNDIGCY